METRGSEVSIRRAGRRGVSLPELLVVVAILALGILVTVPLVADRILAARLRGAVGQYAVSLRAARMLAVSRNAEITVIVEPAPDNVYRYADSSGVERSVEMPRGVNITSSDSPIRFRPDGSLDASTPAITVLRAELGGGQYETYTVTTSIHGVPTVERDTDGGGS
jgi:prepilin-type N-terminal cleavage/methylation domain-containing protein